MDADDAGRGRAAARASTHAEGWITTWLVLAECCHLLGRRLDARFAAALMDDVASSSLSVWDTAGRSMGRRRAAEAPLRPAADGHRGRFPGAAGRTPGPGRILSTDRRDFGACRWKSRKPFYNLLETA